jgi:sugar lactone lactonase YvrE
MPGVEIALAANADLAESPVWDAEDNMLWWVDIFRGEVHRFDPSSGRDELFQIEGPVGSLTLRRSGGLVVALHDGLYAYQPGGVVTPLARPEPDRHHNRFNDGRTDRQGRFWVGSLHLEETEPTGALYRLDPDGRCTRMADGIYAANGTAFSPDGRTGYHADSQRGVVWRFDCDPDTGALANRRVFVEIERRQGAPDGAIVDSDGGYWLTHASGWRLVRYDPLGRVDRIIQLPVEIPTSVAFGGRDGRTLFITTARYSLSPEALSIQPLAGSILAINVGVSGEPDTRFAG